MKKNLTRILSLLLVLVLMVGVLPVSALADGWDLTGELDTEQLLERAEPVEMQASASDFSKILHLDCGRKYFTKDWIIALLYEMQAAGYNQLQLAFGNDGLRFLLNDMSFTANGTTYSHETVVSKVKAGNKAQNSSGDESYLTETEMTEIITKANSLGIEIVPLLNLPGHANALLDIVDNDEYNATVYNQVSQNTLNIMSDDARNFAFAVFKKYVDYFSQKGCKFFNIGADEYGNDVGNKDPHFDALGEANYTNYFCSFMNELAAYIVSKGMTPRAFNDGLYYSKYNPWDMNTSKNTSIKSIQCCYWSSGWGSYPVATASQIASKLHSMINTHGDFYYVLGKSDNFDSGYSYASGFNNTAFAGKATISNPVGSMFCIWCDYPNAETETLVAQKTRLVLRAMAARMDNKSIDTISKAVVANGFNEDGTLNNAGTEFEIVDCDGGTTPTLEVGKALTLCIANGASAEWTAYPEGIVELTAPVATRSAAVTANSVNVTPLKAGDVTITATNPENTTQTATFALTVQARKAENITVYVGQDYSITVNDSVQVEADPDTSIATVTTAAGTSSVPSLEQITSTADLESGKSYLIESAQAANKGNNATLLTNDASGNMLSLSGTQSATPPSAKWTITNVSSGYYYVQSGSNYLNIGDGTAGLSSTNVTLVLSTMQNGGSTYWDISRWNYYHLNQYGGAAAAVAAGYTDSAENDPGSCWNIYKITEGTTPSTTITFHGVAEGDTTATIGGVDYNIHVVSKTLANVDPLEIEFWITNQKLYDNENNHNEENHTMSIQAADANVNSKNGVAIDARTPNLAYNDDNKEHHYWMTVRLDSDHKQTASDGVDQTAVGTTLTHVRYLNDAWQYKTLAGDWESFQTGDQVVAYYLQKTTVTKDIETFVKDWGSVPGAFQGYQVEHVALTIAIVYPDGTIQPAEEKMYSEATTIFNYWNNRNIGIIVPKINENYTISKMTVTDGTRQITSSSDDTNYAWYANDTIKWETVKNEAGVDWYDETLVWNSSMNTEPMINASGLTGELKTKCTWSVANTAKLVLIYLEPIQKDTNLNIVYHNDTDNEAILQSQIAMVYNAGYAQPTYDNSLRKDGNLLPIPTDRKWSGTAPSEPNYLPDEAYVVNAAGNHQTFNKNVAKIPNVAPKYQSGFYKYYGADVSADGKTLTLHYVIDNAKLTKQYVLDFGLPLRIPLSDLIENEDLNTVDAVYANGHPLTSDSDYTTQHGTLRYDAASHEIIYTRTATFSDNTLSTANFQIMYRGAAALSKTITIGVIPASNILYEENFLTPDTGSEWTKGTSSAPTAPQQTQRVDDQNGRDIHVFGFDNVYDNKLGETGVWKADNLDSSRLTKPLTTSFYGNGFDLIGNCGPKTGRVLMIISPADGSKIGARIIDVDTRYNGDSLYQVPLAHVEFNNDAAYNVKIWASGLDKTTASTSRIATASLMDTYSAADDALLQSLVQSYGLSMSDVEHVTMSNVIPASGAADVSLYGMPSAAALTAEPQANVEHQQGTHVEIDSVRVYRSTDKIDDIAGKYPVAEQGIVYNNILDVVKGKILAFTEGDPEKEVVITDYEAAGGPQNEIYIGKGRAITFNVEGATEIQVSLRAVTNAPAKWATSENGGAVSTISTNTEMYYTITKDSSGIFVIANRGDALLAIGNVKLPSGARTMSASEIDEDALRASLCAALGLSAEQPQAFQPKTFTARATTLPMLRNKRVSVLITISNDVSYVTVNGVKYTPSRYYASWQKTRLIQFGETLGKYESKTYTIIAYDANGVASAPITVNG